MMQLPFSQTIVLAKKWLKLALPLHRFAIFCLAPINFLLTKIKRNDVLPNSVLHISYLVHIPFYTVQQLRKQGVKADYLAIGKNTKWTKCDYQIIPFGGLGFLRAFQEFIFFWRVVVKYEVIHMHFMLGLSFEGWELPFLKRMGRKIVVHYRGCEIRDRNKNMQLHPKMNICQQCDYNATVCTSRFNKMRRQVTNKYGDLFLVTTPDMQDFVPQAKVMPFFAPDSNLYQIKKTTVKKVSSSLRIFHTTNHPGIEGTNQIQSVIERLKSKGHPIEFVFLKDATHEQVMEECSKCDIAIGKMKMGHYANAQIESMTLGIPTITYIRPEYMTEELKNSGFIICSLDELESTLEFYLNHPECLAEKRRIAHSSILKIHDNHQITEKLIKYYQELKRLKSGHS